MTIHRTALRLTALDGQLLAALRRHYGQTASGLVRLLIREDARRLGYLAGPFPVDRPAGRPPNLH
jgi:hypothetical protein